MRTTWMLGPRPDGPGSGPDSGEPPGGSTRRRDRDDSPTNDSIQHATTSPRHHRRHPEGIPDHV